MPREEQATKASRRQGQRAVVVAKRLQAAPVLPQWTNFEKAADDDFLIALFEPVQHEPLVNWSSTEHRHRNEGDVAVVLFKNELAWVMQIDGRN